MTGVRLFLGELAYLAHLTIVKLTKNEVRLKFNPFLAPIVTCGFASIPSSLWKNSVEHQDILPKLVAFFIVIDTCLHIGVSTLALQLYELLLLNYLFQHFDIRAQDC